MNLVSEHIWCNDFLVRSFYLKNVQTQETRTLTQFHFLSWPAQEIPTSTRPLLDFRRYCCIFDLLKHLFTSFIYFFVETVFKLVLSSSIVNKCRNLVQLKSIPDNECV